MNKTDEMTTASLPRLTERDIELPLFVTRDYIAYANFRSYTRLYTRGALSPPSN